MAVRKNRNHEEHDIQCAFVQIAKLTPWGEHLAAIPNGGDRNIITAVRLKAEGVKKGVFDMALFIPSKHYHGFFIEFKSSDGWLTPDQAHFAGWRTEFGYLCQVFRDAQLAYQAVRSYLSQEVLDVNQWQQYVKVPKRRRKIC
ncbi:MAG TPA: hypothetical protein VIJ14_00100 [Rhabdochlamydiaceae bacterium]